MEKVEGRLKEILEKCELSCIEKNNFPQLDIVEKLRGPLFLKRGTWVLNLLIALSGFIAYKELYNPTYKTECLYEIPHTFGNAFRPPEYCDICENVTQVEKISNIAPENFYWDYIKSAKPVVVKDGALRWKAMNLFSFEFFKKVYESVAEEKDLPDCQFFPYKTDFKSLQEVFNMSQARATLDPGEKPWYIGFSNCNDEAGNILNQYYEKPYFLSINTESISNVWIFMGGPGYGAHMHVDNVRYPSWQAQLSGRKQWILAPPPECLYQCREMKVTVEPGEIIVLDTNRWYHQTFVQPGAISITVGAEFH